MQEEEVHHMLEGQRLHGYNLSSPEMQQRRYQRVMQSLHERWLRDMPRKELRMWVQNRALSKV